ncbi:hypothetical protein BJ742DRAFT_840478 [Cladochytrium replicatum]|nr:hypothetical protein BJ742DRAFT_840478 [Cladochytrium replicatum]
MASRFAFTPARTCMRSLRALKQHTSTGAFKESAFRSFYSTSTRSESRKSPCLYDVLEIKPTATYKEIRAAYRNLVLHLHPDRNATHGRTTKSSIEAARTRFINVARAHGVLANPATRKSYDSDRFKLGEKVAASQYMHGNGSQASQSHRKYRGHNPGDPPVGEDIHYHQWYWTQYKGFESTASASYATKPVHMSNGSFAFLLMGFTIFGGVAMALAFRVVHKRSIDELDRRDAEARSYLERMVKSQKEDPAGYLKRHFSQLRKNGGLPPLDDGFGGSAAKPGEQLEIGIGDASNKNEL